MVLVLNGVLQEECPASPRSLLAAHPVYRDSAAHLLNIPGRVVGPHGLLYVNQREFAATIPLDKNVTILGSDDATSCIIAVVRHSGSGAVAMAHLDGAGTEDCATNMVSRVQQLALGYPEGRIELQLVGGYLDPRRYSDEVFAGIMQAFHRLPLEIDLMLACCGELNTRREGSPSGTSIAWPALYGVAVDVRTGDLFPATFPDRGPDLPLRTARLLTGKQDVSQVLEIYDSSLGMLRIGPFNYEPLRGVDLWLEQSDDFILQHLSTSPLVEPPHYVSQMRQTLKYIQDNQFPAVTVFRDNRPHYYRRDEHTGAWQPVRY